MYKYNKYRTHKKPPHSEVNNIQIFCKDHGPQAGEYTGKPPGDFIGKLVKRVFQAKKSPIPGMISEHMWVKIHDINGNRLIGTLDNQPILDVGLKYGDMVTVELTEIEDIMD